MFILILMSGAWSAEWELSITALPYELRILKSNIVDQVSVILGKATKALKNLIIYNTTCDRQMF